MKREIIQTISPIDGSVYAERPLATDSEIERTLVKSVAAQNSWKLTSIEQRAAICRKAIAYFVEHAFQIGEELTRQMGRPIKYTPGEITGGFQERASYMVDVAERALSDTIIEDSEFFKRFIRKEPLGTVLVLSPWNYPYLTSVNAVIPAIMAGNAVILKHAQQTPLCAERYAKAFQAAGLPDGVFQYLHINHNQVAKVIGDSRVDFVSFTGSVSGGEAIQKAIDDRFIIAGLELGGKDPAYVRHDANLDFTVGNLVDGAFFNSGQSCCGIERIYVHEDLYDSFVESFVSLTKNYVLDNPLDEKTTLGPMIRPAAALFVQKQIDDAIQSGAKTWIDPKNFKAHDLDLGYMAPQVLTSVDHHMQVMSEESFGPVVGIMSVKNDEEAICLMNDCKYGLSASIWSEDVQEAGHIGNRIETGTLFLNRCDYLDPALAWTGLKESGRGCTLSQMGYDALTRPKSFHLRKKT